MTTSWKILTVRITIEELALLYVMRYVMLFIAAAHCI